MWYLSKELALTCGSVTVLLWAVALRYGSYTRKAQRAYQDRLAETNQVCTGTLSVSNALMLIGQGDSMSLQGAFQGKRLDR